MARRTRRPKVVWLPPNDSNPLIPSNTSVFQEFVVGVASTVVNTAGDVSVGEIPLTIDGTFDLTDPDVSLSDVYNSGYRLRRIVGKIFLAVTQDQEDAPPVVGVTAGIIVRREDPSTGGSMAQAFGTRDISPDEIENAPDPWVWKRSWILGQNSATQANTTFPPLNTTNFAVGAGPAMVDGPHIDQKTARIISQEERLFLDVSVRTIQGAAVGLLTNVRVITDLRYLVSLRTTSGNRRNASR